MTNPEVSGKNAVLDNCCLMYMPCTGYNDRISLFGLESAILRVS